MRDLLQINLCISYFSFLEKLISYFFFLFSSPINTCGEIYPKTGLCHFVVVNPVIGYVIKQCYFVLQEIKQLCTYLVDLKKASAEEMRRSVYANYAAFIRLVVC